MYLQKSVKKLIAKIFFQQVDNKKQTSNQKTECNGAETEYDNSESKIVKVRIAVKEI